MMPESSATTPKLVPQPEHRQPKWNIGLFNEFVIQTQVEDRIHKLDFSYRKSRTKRATQSTVVPSSKHPEIDSFSCSVESYIFILIADVLN